MKEKTTQGEEMCFFFPFYTWKKERYGPDTSSLSLFLSLSFSLSLSLSLTLSLSLSLSQSFTPTYDQREKERTNLTYLNHNLSRCLQQHP